MNLRIAVPIAAGVVLAGLVMTGHIPLSGKQPPAGRPAAAPTNPVAPTTNPIPVVTVHRALPHDFVATTRVTGSLVAHTEILVAPEIEGLRVLELAAEEGDRVTKGQVLARLVADGLDAQLAQNDASRARTEAAIAQAHSQIAQAEAREVEARANLERAKPLKKSGVISNAVFDQREMTARTASAQLVATRDGLKVAEAERAQVVAQRRELDWRRSNTEVKAPAEGIVSRRTARVGALASAAGEALFRIVADGAVELEAEVPESEIARLAEGQRAVITVTGIGDLQGRVRLVPAEIDKATRLGRVRIAIDDPRRLRIGAFARGSVETGRSRGHAVPAGAVVNTVQGPEVQIVRDGIVSTRRIRLGLAAGGLIEAIEGLRDGDAVIAKAGTFLRNGDRVRAVASTPATVSEAH